MGEGGKNVMGKQKCQKGCKEEVRKGSRIHTQDCWSSFHCVVQFGDQPEVATANVRDLGCKEVQSYQISKALDVAHAHICEEAGIQVELSEAGEA